MPSFGTLLLFRLAIIWIFSFFVTVAVLPLLCMPSLMTAPPFRNFVRFFQSLCCFGAIVWRTLADFRDIFWRQFYFHVCFESCFVYLGAIIWRAFAYFIWRQCWCCLCIFWNNKKFSKVSLLRNWLYQMRVELIFEKDAAIFCGGKRVLLVEFLENKHYSHLIL